MKSIFEKLRELENDDLRFSGIEHGPSGIRIEATSYLKGDTIDVMVREKLSGIGLVLENMRCNSSQDVPEFFGQWSQYEYERWKKTPRHTYYTFLYDIAKVKSSGEVPDKHVGDCPDCKDGFYYPFVGPKEPCPTCKGEKPPT